MKIPASISRPAFRTALLLKKQAPTILFVGGVAGVVTSTVMACRATLKLADEMPKMKEDLEAVREVSADLPEDERKKAIAKVYGVNTYKVVTMYGPSVLVGAVSITAITGSHVILTRRNAAYAAAYAALATAYDDYRARVRDEHGEERELALYHGVENKGTKKNPDMQVISGNSSMYARFFDESCPAWQKDAQLNMIFATCQEQWANDRLVSRGHLFLNEVYEEFGLPHTKEGAVVGWLYNSEVGDQYVDFGLYNPVNENFIAGIEPRILLDFNVDGIIFDKLGD